MNKTHQYSNADDIRQRIEDLKRRDDEKKEQLIKWQEKFETLLKTAWREPWWREVIKIITERRQMLSEQLESGMFESRKEEERARGQISELKLILNIDMQGRQLNESTRENENA